MGYGIHRYIYIEYNEYMEGSRNGGTPIAGWFSSWKSIYKMDDLEGPPFQETSINMYICNIFMCTILYHHYGI